MLNKILEAAHHRGATKLKQTKMRVTLSRPFKKYIHTSNTLMQSADDRIPAHKPGLHVTDNNLVS